MGNRVKTTLLIDADILAYRVASRFQKSYDFGDGEDPCVAVGELGEAQRECKLSMENVTDELNADGFVVCLSDDNANWRKSVLPTYKGHRKDSVRPELLYPLKDYLANNFTSYRRPTLEADDVMGIIATTPAILPGHRKIIVSIDKDLKQIPGLLHNGTDLLTISKDEADWWHWMQMLTGDAVDGYKGCPGVGPVKAAAIVNEGPRNLMEDIHGFSRWSRVVAAYIDKDLTEADALVQARVARICRHEDYDFKKKEVRLWSPKE